MSSSQQDTYSVAVVTRHTDQRSTEHELLSTGHGGIKQTQMDEQRQAQQRPERVVDLTDYYFLDLVERCDNFRPTTSSEPLLPLLLTPTSPRPLGLLRPALLAQLADDDPDGALIALAPTYAFFAPALSTPALRTAALARLTAQWHAQGVFADVIGGRLWRGELYDVYEDPFGPRRVDGQAEECGNWAFALERAACALFGVVTYGVHATVFEEHEDGLRVWVPRRAASKQTFPGMLDNSVAGGITSGSTIYGTLEKEAGEEASLPPAAVRAHARAVGAMSYFFRTARGWLQPEVEFVYDMCVPAGALVLRPMDGEVESFTLMTLEEMVAHMRRGEFKPNCAVVLLDFLIRRGIVTPDNEPDYMQIVTRLHGRFDIDKW